MHHTVNDQTTQCPESIDSEYPRILIQCTPTYTLDIVDPI